MKFDIGAIFGQIISLYTRLPLSQKIALPFLIAASMGAIIFVSRWAGRPDYQVLFSGLEQSDAASVVEYLKEQKVAYRIRDDGGTIDVSPPEMVHDLRLQLSAAGLPKGGTVGFELFNENGLGRTGFTERVTLIRAVQGELERTIMSIEAVKAVRVHITNPERSVFTKKDVLPTASVVMRLKAGKELSGEQIKGITYLVSNSVERLKPENVTILDSHGNLLSDRREEEKMNGVDMTRIEYQRSIESAYVKRIETMLGEVLGAGKAVARVTTDLDFSKYEKEEEVYDPSGRVTRSERAMEEAGGSSAAEGGVPGVISNLGGKTNLAAPDSSKSTSSHRENVKNYEISRAVSRTASATGKILKMSVAVLVDGQYVQVPTSETAPDGTPIYEKHYQPLPAEVVRKIENLVKQSVGFDPTRGDIVTVENIQFFEPDESLEHVMEQAELNDRVMRLGGWAMPAIFTLLFFFVVVKPLIKFITSPTEAEVDLSRLLPAGIQELEAELATERAKVSSMPDSVGGPAIDIEELENLLASNSKIVKENPQQAALLIRYWLNDGRF